MANKIPSEKNMAEPKLLNPFVSSTVFVSWKDLRPRHFLASFPIIIITVIVASLLMKTPGLSWGWWKALGGQGNLLVADFRNNENIVQLGQTAHWVTVLVTIIPMCAVGLLLLFVFRLVASEEESYRAGLHKKDWKGFIKVTIGFAAAHLIVGIPIGAAIALIIPGAFFGLRYLKGYHIARLAETNNAKTYMLPKKYSVWKQTLQVQTGHIQLPTLDKDIDIKHQKAGLKESTLYHAAYNITILVPVLIIFYLAVVTVAY